MPSEFRNRFNIRILKWSALSLFFSVGHLTEPIVECPSSLLVEAPPPGGTYRRSAFLSCFLCALIVFAPLVAYWPTIFHYYGLRDSYSNLREAHEEPGKLVHFCASHARPIYGWLLEITLRRVDTIQQLQWIRLVSTLMLGTVSLAVYRTLRRIGWSIDLSVLFSLWLGLIPSAQVIAGWAIGWPYSVATLISLWAFYSAEKAIGAGERTWVGSWWIATSMGLVATSALIYQPNALFYAVPLAAALVVRRGRSQREDVRWVMCHVLNLSAGLLLAYVAIQGSYLTGVFRRSARVAFEADWTGKMIWFLKAPLPNALSEFIINDDHGHGRSAYLSGVAVAGLILCAGTWLEWRRRGCARGVVWIAGLVGLPIFAFSINILAAERYATYRTIFALTGVLLCFLLASLRSALSALSPWSKRAGSILLIAAAMVVARHRAFALLAVPQGNEWHLVLQGAERVNLVDGRPSIFMIEPTPDDISTDTIYHDEFGSLSSNSDWVPKEMFGRAMHDLHLDVPRLNKRYNFSSGPQLPKGQQFDVVIDMRQLRSFRISN